MKRILLLIVLFSVGWMQGQARPTQQIDTDSLMRTLWKYSERYGKLIQHYESKLYIKRYVQKDRKNVLMELVPQVMSFEKGTNEYVSESISQLNYTAPSIYDRHVIAAYGTIPNLKKVSDMILDYFTMSLYKKHLISDHLLSPFFYENRNYYYYRLVSIGEKEATLRFIPQYSNTQLVEGTFVLDLEHHLVKSTQFEGRYEFMQFKVHMQMGSKGLEVYLPSESELNFKFSFAGNVLHGHYLAAQEYQEVSQEYATQYRYRRHAHDLTDQYSLSLDTTRFQFDSLRVAQNRIYPLTNQEQQIYEHYAHRRDSLKYRMGILAEEQAKAKGFSWGSLGKSIVASYTVNAPLFGKMKSSALLAPMLFHYSKTRGLDWRQELSLEREYRRTGFQLKPMIGYNLTFKEFDWSLKAGYDYWNPLQAHLELEIGNGYRTYSSDLIDLLSNVKAKDIEKLQLQYFNDVHIRLNQKLEILNGLEITVGINWYKRHLSHKYGTSEEYAQVLGNLKDRHTTFAPRARLDWTPGKYYYWNRNKKVTVETPYPTFSVDWEKGLEGVLGSEGSYQRYELEMSHEREYREQDRFSYRLGYGKFTHQNGVYFVDFNNFSHSRLPDGWTEEIGGNFHLLDYRWYSVANEYFRGHLTYESPDLFLTRLFRGASHAIQGERLYLSGVAMKHLTPYLEIGYGFATHIFDFGLFASLMNGQPGSLGVKFSFQLFKK